MSNKPPFFFDPEPATTQTPRETVGSSSFFDALKGAGIIQSPDSDALPFETEGKMEELKTEYLIFAYGTYKDDYSIHIEPCHPKKNLSTPVKVELAIVEALKLIRPHVSDSMRIDVFLPRSEWERKVISIVLRGGAKAFGFRKDVFEEETPQQIFMKVQEVILK